MKSQILNTVKIAALTCLLSQTAQAQTEVANLRPYDKTGINVFEAAKDTNAVFESLKIKWGAGFTQSFQNLKHKNAANNLYKISPGFNTANANLFMDVQLADGIRLNLTSYLSSRHHNETWVKGGYIQFDKLPFKGQIWDNIMKYTTLKVGHSEINYGDQHFRRSDGGQTLYNPFVENYIMDAFATEIGGEVLVRNRGAFVVLGVSNGLIKGNIDSVLVTKNAQGAIIDDNQHKSPSIFGKVGYDTQLLDKVRVRVAASFYHNNSAGNNGNTLYGGDRAGSNYFMVLEPAVTGTPAAAPTYASAAFSGRYNPGFSKKIDALQFNTFAKAYGLELFGTYEIAKGRSNKETATRDAKQFALEGVYRFGKDENLFVGARYNTVEAEVVAGAADSKINRTSFCAGWFLTKNILLKGEYTTQEYKNFAASDIRNGAKFDGYVIQAVVGF